MTAIARFRVLFVSTGNVCRSPLAERLLRRELERSLGESAAAFRCESAGTWGHEGATMEEFAAGVLAERGAATDGFVARELSAAHVSVADLVLTASREHREQVRLLDPYATPRTFTIREFARFARMVDTALPGDEVARARTLVERVGELRTPRPGPGRVDDDIADPYGAPQHVFHLCARSITEGLGVLLAHLTPTSSARIGSGRGTEAG